jgi:IS6 family transposase
MIRRNGYPQVCSTPGFEIMRMIRRGHCDLREPGATGEIRLVNQLFGLAA